MELPEELLEHLSRISGVDPGRLRQVVRETLAYFGETAPEFVARRHRELQADGLRNAAIFERLQQELDARRFAAGKLTERQLRRLIYG